MKLYLVTKEGVYCQGVYFISKDEDKAISTAQTLAENDIDDYHQWDVSEIETNRTQIEALPLITSFRKTMP